MKFRHALAYDLPAFARTFAGDSTRAVRLERLMAEKVAGLDSEPAVGVAWLREHS